MPNNGKKLNATKGWTVAGKNGRKRYPDPAQSVLGQEPDRAWHLAWPPQ